MRAIPPEVLDTPAAWRGPGLAGDWIETLAPGLVAELEDAARAAQQAGTAPEALTARDFDGPLLARASDRWLAELGEGRGFLLLRGLPVGRWGDALSSLACLGIGLSMGSLASQNAAGDRLGHVRDTGADPNDPAVRLYKTREPQPFHTDGADVIGLLCLRPAKSGGASRIVSSTTVVAEVQRRRPDLVPLLFEPFHFDRNEEQGPGEAPTFQLPIAHVADGRLRVFYIGWYIRGAQRHTSVPRLTPAQNELLDLIDALAASPELCLPMEFRPGDVQLLKNASILHARDGYTDWDQPARKRHLLRFWVAARSDFAGSADLLRGGIPAREGAASDREALKAGKVDSGAEPAFLR
ncbi:MAG: TauD/TfdA family dioxygenase [Myxococcota bacterium]